MVLGSPHSADSFQTSSQYALEYLFFVCRALSETRRFVFTAPQKALSDTSSRKEPYVNNAPFSEFPELGRKERTALAGRSPCSTAREAARHVGMYCRGLTS